MAEGTRGKATAPPEEAMLAPAFAKQGSLAESMRGQ